MAESTFVSLDISQVQTVNRRHSDGSDGSVSEVSPLTVPQAEAKPMSEVTQNVDETDPFAFKHPFTLCNKILIFLNAFWLLPLRLLFVLPTVFIGTCVFLVSTICEHFDPDNPTPRTTWRRVFTIILIRIVNRCFLFFCGFHWIHYKGRPADAKDAPIIIAAPHSSMFDVFAVGLYDIPTFVAREDMRNVFLFGPTVITKAMRTIFVDRDDPDSRTKAAQEIRKRATSEGMWPKVLIFPEATTHNREVLLYFKSGAFQPSLPVQPYLIKYGKLGTTTWARGGLSVVLKSLLYTLCQFHNPLEVEFLDVYIPSEEEKKDPLLYARNVQILMARALKIHAGMQSVEDRFLMIHGHNYDLPYISCLIPFNVALRDTSLKYNEVRDFLTRFASIDSDKDGFITIMDMASFLSVPNDACLQALFKTDDNTIPVEKMSFKQYLYQFISRARQLRNKEFLKSVFNFFDQDGDGLVSMSDISRTLPFSRLPQVKQLENRQQRKQNMGVENTSEEANEANGRKEDLSMDFDQFKSMLDANPEYILLFHECQNAGISSSNTTTTTTKPESLSTRIVVEIKEETETIDLISPNC